VTMDIVEAVCEGLRAIREKRPLVHSITNYVVMNETANALLCTGALPIMSHAREEVQEMAALAGALVLNIGTLEPDWVDAMELAGVSANQAGVPVILDPVGAGATRLRTDSSKRLLRSVRISIIRGNAAEVSTLAGLAAEIRGVESIAAPGSIEETAGMLATEYGATVAVTGKVDVVSDGTRTAHISNGDAMLGRVVGTGCMASVMVGAFAAVNPDSFVAAVGGLATFGIAGEIAAEASGGKPGTFHTELYNALYAITADDIRSRAKIGIGE
jgi:hydroxyethylthiazole kinase